MELTLGTGLAGEARVRLLGLVIGWRWARSAVAAMRRQVRTDGLDVTVIAPTSVAPGTLRGARIALRLDRASCLERSLVIQRWWAANGVSLDVIVGVRHPRLTEGDLAHAWVDRYDADCSDRYPEIRRVKSPATP
ncbi:MAG: lasso peptide biosynthesis protein [Solirubrobacteraceae bacterium]|nr:lasso peptide biosynthesis protein [Patulibacter sp.]